MLFSQTKQKYGFVLGHCPELSRAEIVKVLEFFKIEQQLVFSSNQIFIIEVRGHIDIQGLQERLGGTVKISHIAYRLSRINLEKTVETLITKRLKDLKTKRLKFQFGFSTFGVSLKELEEIGLTIKKKLTNDEIKSRLVVSQEPVLSSVIVQKEKLIEQGADLVVVKADNQYFIGYTIAVQKFADYSLRDYGRPTRDDKSGLLPPKLAKMMINISQADNQHLILDPFCGSGTIIQEVLLMGYKNIVGSDVSPKAIEFTRNNLEWLRTKYKIDISGVKIYQQDVRQLSKVVPRLNRGQESIDAIVTEPYLGPARASSKLQIPSNKKYPITKSQTNSNNQIPNIIKELSDLYIKSFEEFYQVLKKEGKVVIIFPIINKQKLDILNDIKRMGFIVESLGKEPRRSIVYSRPGQVVEREIFIFKKHG